MFETQPETPETATRWEGAQGVAVRSRKRRANEYMRDALRLLDPDDMIPFFCECGHTDCSATVWLTGRRFDRMRAGSAPELSAHAEAALVPAGT